MIEPMNKQTNEQMTVLVPIYCACTEHVKQDKNPYAGLRSLLIQEEMCMHHNNAAALHLLVPQNICG